MSLERQLPPVNQPLPSEPPIQIPSRSVEFAHAADVLAQKLITDPRELSPFLRTATLRRLEIRAHPDPYGRRDEPLVSFLRQVQKRVESHPWQQLRQRELSVEDTSALLEHLLPPDLDKRRKRKQPEAAIIEGVARGYLDTRFQDKKLPDWRGALISVHTFLEAAVADQSLALLYKWFHLVSGSYPQIMPQMSSVAWRSVYLGIHAIDQADQSYMAAAAAITSCRNTASLIFCQPGEKDPNVGAYNPLAFQYSVAAAALQKAPDADLSSGTGRKLYDLAKKVAFQSGYKRFKQHSQANAFPTLDILEVAKQAADPRNRQRKAYHDQYKEMMAPGGEEQRVVVAELDGNPITGIMLHNYPVKAQLAAIVDPVYFRQLINEEVQKRLAAQPNLISVPVAFQGVRGYALAPLPADTPNSEATRWVLDQLAGLDRSLAQQVSKTMMEIGGLFVPLDIGECQFLLAPERSVDITEAETLLNLTIPPVVRASALELVKTNMALRERLAGEFRRFPTRAGDHYQLTNHPDLPNVVAEASIKRVAKKCIYFSLKLCDITEVTGGKPITITGAVDFINRRVNIHFAKEPAISADQQWIMEQVVLHLVEVSCCPPSREVEDEVRQLRSKLENHSEQSYPGYIGHVGPRGTEQGQYTDRAAANLARVGKELYEEMGLDVTDPQFDLAEINKAHREGEPDDPRYLTYTQGRESGDPNEPPIEKSVERLIVLEPEVRIELTV